jgi:hypothetical protein
MYTNCRAAGRGIRAAAGTRIDTDEEKGEKQIPVLLFFNLYLFLPLFLVHWKPLEAAGNSLHSLHDTLQSLRNSAVKFLASLSFLFHPRHP